MSFKEVFSSWLHPSFKEHKPTEYLFTQLIGELLDESYIDITDLNKLYDNYTNDEDILNNLIEHYKVYLPGYFKDFDTKQYFLTNRRDWIQLKGKFRLFDFVLLNMLKLPKEVIAYHKMWTKHNKYMNYTYFTKDYGFNNVYFKDEEYVYAPYFENDIRIEIDNLFNGKDMSNFCLSLHYNISNLTGNKQYIFQIVDNITLLGVYLIKIDDKKYDLCFIYDNTEYVIKTFDFTNQDNKMFYDFVSLGISYFNNKIDVFTRVESEILGDGIDEFNLSVTPLNYNNAILYLGNSYTNNEALNGSVTKLKFFNRYLPALALDRVWERDEYNKDFLYAYYPLSFDIKDYSGNSNPDGISNYENIFRAIETDKFYVTPHLHIEIDINKLHDDFNLMPPDLLYKSDPVYPLELKDYVDVNNVEIKIEEINVEVDNNDPKQIFIIVSHFNFVDGFGEIIVTGESIYDNVSERIYVEKEGLHILKTSFKRLVKLEYWGKFRFRIMKIREE